MSSFVVAIFACSALSGNEAMAKGDHVVVVPSAHNRYKLPQEIFDGITLNIEEQLMKRLHYPLRYPSLLNVVGETAQFAKSNSTNELGAEEQNTSIFDEVLSRFPEVDALLQHKLLLGESSALVLEVFDPYSQTLLFSVSLPLNKADEVHQALNSAKEQQLSFAKIPKNVSQEIFSLSSQIGQIAAERLESIDRKVTIKLLLSGFKVDELVPVTTYLLSLSPKNQVTLLDTVQLSSLFSRLLPVVSTRYALTSDMSVSQLHNELVRFWKLQDISIDITFSRESRELTINRVNNPYTPSVVSTTFGVLLLLIVTNLFIRRYYFHHQLEMLAQGKRADEWLDTYARANKPWLRLEERWKNQLNYWQQIKRESTLLEKQAKTCFDAGDANSSKIFISKALNINANAPVALKLMHAVESFENDAKQLSEQEQWIRNKVAKAMSNYRNNQPFKALRQAYQAEDSAKQQKHLKKQLKAIRKLINRINNELSPEVDRVKIIQTSLPHELNVGAESTLFIGRDDADFLPKDNDTGVVIINHKGLSRIGRHLKISNKNDGFFIQDIASTNGVFVDGVRLQRDEEQRLRHNNELMLGAESSLAAVGFKVGIGNKNSVLVLTADDELQKKIPINELSRIWPDYLHAMRSDIALVGGENFVYLNQPTGKLVLFDAPLKVDSADARHSSSDYEALFVLELGASSSIAPIEVTSGTNAKVVDINGHKLLGKMPLLLPIDIRCNDIVISIQLNSSTFMSDLDMTSTRMLITR